ncbi:MAG: hypothetical protein V1837_05070 [Candidatus Woesearchaeota archaeon]
MAEISQIIADASEPSLVVTMAGAIESGKSELLTALHKGLRYANASIKINRGRFLGKVWARNVKKMWERQNKGIQRLAATDEPDLLPLYAVLDGKPTKIDIYAPGGHSSAVKLDKQPDCMLYLVDLGLVAFTGELLSRHNAVFPLWENYVKIEGAASADSIRDYFYKILSSPYVQRDTRAYFSQDGLEKLVVPAVPAFGLPHRLRKEKSFNRRLIQMDSHSYFFYGQELLADVVESLIESYASLAAANVPVYGIITHTKSAPELACLKEEELLKTIGIEFNKLTESYQRYLALYEASIEKPIFNFSNSSKIKNWQLIDSVNANKAHIIQAMHQILSATLKEKGYQAEDFKLISFSPNKQGNSSVIPYSQL